MGHMIELTCADGFKLAAYRAEPAGQPRAGIVVLQEIFGVNVHIKSVADRYAAMGYLAVAPAMFDRVERNVSLGYEGEEYKRGFELIGKVDHAKSPLDVQSAIEAAREGGKAGVVGFCWGGTLAFAAACKLEHVAASVGYYGGGIAERADWRPKAPLMLHFGETDPSIPLASVERIRSAQPDVPVHVYPGAGHAFNRDASSAYHEASAKLAQERTAEFFAAHL